MSGLLHEDLDDQHDTIRAALEIDPLLSAWTVCQAYRMTCSKLPTIDAASRWLAVHLLSALPRAACLIPPQLFDAHQRATWRNIVVLAVATARKARQIAVHSEADSPSRAFWLAQLWSVHETLSRGAPQNGHFPIHTSSIAWPSWLVKQFKSVRGAADVRRTEYAVQLAQRTLTEHPDQQEELVEKNELQLWFRPYPEFRSVVPGMLRKLQRLSLLEDRFESALQQEKLASLEQFAYGASHEINNPLANISTRAQTLLYNEHDTERRRKLVAINEQAFRAYEMIADLMLFAKPPPLDMADVSLASLVRTLRAEMEPIAAGRGAQLQFNVQDESLCLMADPIQLAVAIKAICTNGLEAMEQGGVLSLDVALEPNIKQDIEITIEDSGPGLSEQARRHLFDPFYSGREAGRGLGFGLCKAWRIIEQHGGTISVSNKPARGCTFGLAIPRAGRIRVR